MIIKFDKNWGRKRLQISKLVELLVQNWNLLMPYFKKLEYIN